MQNTRFIVYLRKSNESEDKQELSIKAQRRELQELAKRMNLSLVGEPLEESRSAKTPGRPLFNEMLDRIRRGEADGILCWKLNRLARNPKDGGTIMWDLGENVIKEIVIPGRTYVGSGSDKLLMSIEFGMSTKFSDDLSEDVRRGNREALEAGRWPGYPKIGYVRDTATKNLVADPERFDDIQELWQMVLQGKTPRESLRVAREEMKLRTPKFGKNGGSLLSKAQLYKMLHDVFYTGIMVRGGKVYEGNHPPMVTRAQFEQVQELISRNTKPKARPRKLFFTYRGMIQCGECGALVTAERTVNRYGKKYVHYHCCRKEKRYLYCPQKSLEERKLEDQLSVFLSNIAPPPEWSKEAIRVVERTLLKDADSWKRQREKAERRTERLERRLKKLREMCADGLISEEDYTSDAEELIREKQQLNEAAQRCAKPQELVELFVDSISFVNQANIVFATADPPARRQVVQSLTSNLQLKDKILLIQAKEPFATIGRSGDSITLLGRRDSNDTWNNLVVTNFATSKFLNKSGTQISHKMCAQS